ncbi:Transmembrane secretion effector [Streptomyces aidingensis]|uniref:Transmembrane secretion effector n=2 Tax=Streptomyces aidingensis TaxID=910347 RepID=A0A1I1JPK3_9ACTN|nr:Transmembrane secretion effector [Streptomyces aidingensis]
MRWWSAANLVSNLGTWMQMTVQNVLVLQVTGSAAMTGLSLAVQAGPGLLFGLLGGAAVDALPRKLVAGVSQAALAMVAFTTALLVALGALGVPALLVLAAVTGLIATVDGPACALLGNDLVPARDVPSAIALGSAVHSVGRLAGTALAGVAVVLFGTAAAFVANGLSFLFVAAVIPFLKLLDRSAEGEGDPVPAPVPVTGPRAAATPHQIPKPAPLGPPRPRTPENEPRAAGRPGEPARDGERAVAGPREGLAFFFGRPRLVALALLTALSAVFGRNYSLTLAVLVTGPLAAGAGAFGTVATALAVGGTLGAVVAGMLRKPSVRLVAGMAATGALLQIAAGLSPTLLLLTVLVVPMAIVESVSDTAGTTVLQTDPPAAMRGRVLGVWRSLSTGWGLLGPLAAGGMMELLGARASLVLGGVVIAATAGAAVLLRAGGRSPVALPRPRLRLRPVRVTAPQLSPAA